MDNMETVLLYGLLAPCALGFAWLLLALGIRCVARLWFDEKRRFINSLSPANQEEDRK